jgi:hypothetical protein
MKRFLYVLAVALLSLAPLASKAYTYTWSVLAVSSDWGNGLNWGNDGGLLNALTVPHAGDDVVINGTLLTFYPVVSASGGACKSITISGANATLTVNGTLAVGGNAIFSGSAVAVTVASGGTLAITGTTAISGSGVNVTVASGGTLNITGSTSFTNSNIKLTVSGTATTGAISLGSATGSTLTVNGTLTSSGTISQSLPSAAGNVNTAITGTGSISCSAINMGTDNTVPAANGTNTTTIKSNVKTLTVTNLITINSASATSKLNNAVFDVANDNGNTTVTAGGISMTNFAPVTGVLSSFLLDNTSTGATTLKLTGNTPVSISANGKVDFYNTGTGSSTVEYAGASAQAVAASSTGTGLDATPAIYQNLIFSGAGAKTIASGTLSLSGDWNSSGGKVDGLTNNSTVTFNGAAQTLYDAGSTSGGVTFKNVNFQGGNTKTISGTSATANGFSVAGTGVLTMSANTTLTIDSLGKLTLNSNANGTASVATIPSGCSITGIVNVQRYIKAGTIAANARNYRLLSSPVNVNATPVINNSGSTAYYTLAYLTGSNTGVFTGGPGGTGNGFSVANTTPTIYLYKENLPASNATFNSGNFKGLTNIASDPQQVYDDAGTNPNVNATIYAGNGYMLYYVGNNTANTFNKQNRVGGAYADPDASTATAVGALNQGDIPVKLWWNSSTTLSAVKTGYNLVGNPYASTIDWNLVSGHNTSVNNKIYVYDYTSKTYGTYQPGLGSDAGTHNAGRYIGSGQGFFVVAPTTGNPTLTFSETDKVTTQPTAGTLLMSLPAQMAGAPQVLRIKLAKDSINTDEALVAFEADAQDSLEDRDALRLNGIGNVATLATYPRQNTQMLVINHLHSIDSATRIKLYVNMTDTKGIDSLSFAGLSTLDTRYDVFLIDHYKQDSLQINLYPHYSFNIRPDSAASYGAGRFELVFHKKNAMNYRLLSFTGMPANEGINIKWRVEAEQNATGFVLEKNDGRGTFNPVYNLQSDGSGAYTWLDRNPATGFNQYRLKQDDIFGSISYSNVLSVNFNPPGIANNIITVYPNPVQTSLQVSINSPVIPAQVLMKVFSSNGQTLISKIASGNVIQQNVGNLLPGTYIVELSDNATKKIIGRVKISKS